MLHVSMRMRDEANYAEYNKERCSRVAYSRAQHSSEKKRRLRVHRLLRANAPYGARGLLVRACALPIFHDLVSGARYLDKQH